MMQTDVLTKIDDVLNKKPAPLIVHDGTNDLTNDINLLSNVKKIVNKTNKTSPNTADFFKSDFHRMTVSVLKTHFRKLPPKFVTYRDFKKFENEKFMHSLKLTLNSQDVDSTKNTQLFF